MGNTPYVVQERVFINPHINTEIKNESFSDFGYGAYFTNAPTDHVPFFKSDATIAYRPRLTDIRRMLGDSYPAAFNQGKINACTSYASVGAIEIASRFAKTSPPWQLFPLFLYGQTLRKSIASNTTPNARVDTTPVETITGNKQAIPESKAIPELKDIGATILDTLEVATARGVSSVTSSDPGFVWNSIPSSSMFSNAMNFRVSSFMKVDQSLRSIRDALCSQLPVIFVLVIDRIGNDWMRSRDQQQPDFCYPVPWGAQDISAIIGAHALLIVGYDDIGEVFTIRNSWGPEWGQRGHFYIPYKLVLMPLWCREFFVQEIKLN